MVVLVTLCGVLLLLAQVQVGMRLRHQELVVYRTLGAGKRLLRPRCGVNLRCSDSSPGWWRRSVRKRRWRWQTKSLTSLGARLAVVGRYLCGAILLSACGGWLGTRPERKALFRQFDQ
jgi:putative ABC transport system permease protein